METVDILHFNDVYHLSEVDRVSKFASVIGRESHSTATEERAFIVFSGDCFSPSLESSMSQGECMIPVLNSIGLDVACPGNHDFDFGGDRLQALVEKSNFPWTLSNYLGQAAPASVSSVLQKKNLLAGTCSYVIRTKRGIRFGFFGLGGTDWPSLSQTLPPCRVEDPVMTARTMARYLRESQSCDVVIALTHMRLVEDLKVADATNARDNCHVDLLLGGHDHEVVCRVAGDTCSNASQIWENVNNDKITSRGRVVSRSGQIRIIKSGSDFHSFSKIKLFFQHTSSGRARLMNITAHQMTDLSWTGLRPPIGQQTALRRYLLGVQHHLGRLVDIPIARIGEPMDGRETHMRSRGTNLGNFLCDMLKLYFDTDVAFTNSGSIRSDSILGPKASRKALKQEERTTEFLRVREILDMLPFKDTFEIKLLTGKNLKRLLEVSVSEDSPEGKFLQVSGISFDVDRRLQQGFRVSNLRLQPLAEQPKHAGALYHPTMLQTAPTIAIQSERLYTAALPSFLARGYDGYDDIQNIPSIQREGFSWQPTHSELMLCILGSSIGQKDHQLGHNKSSNSADIGSLMGNFLTFPVRSAHKPLASDISEAEGRALSRARRGLVRGLCETTNLPVIVASCPGRVRILGSSIECEVGGCTE